MKKKKVFIIKRRDWDYDETVSVVVVAEGEAEARKLAYDFVKYGDGFCDPLEFLNPEYSTCEEVDLTVSKLIHEHFRHALIRKGNEK